MFVIRKINEDGRPGWWVADQRKRAGGSYTNRLQYAKTYATREAADADRCVQNEFVEEVSSILT